MRKKILFLALLLVLLSGYSNAQVSTNANAPDDKVLGQLKKGMTQEQLVKVLGKAGRPRENSPPFQRVLEFDFDGLSVWVKLEWSQKDKVHHVTDFKIRKDGQTIAQREAERMKEWSRWVQAHERTKPVPNKPSETPPPGTPQ